MKCPRCCSTHVQAYTANNERDAFFECIECGRYGKIRDDGSESDPQVDNKPDSPSPKAKSDKVGTGLALIPMYSILEIGKIFIEGLRYGRDNWKKGVNDPEYQEERLEHALLHLMKWKEGDRSESHLAKVAWFCVTQLELERLENEKQSITSSNNQTTT